MSNGTMYPQINIRSKNELAKHISGGKLQFEDALRLINDATSNFNTQWYDSKRSEPENGKYVRSAVGKPLGTLLGLIDKKVLATHDHLVPEFIFGGLSGKSHIHAAYHLLGNKRKRILLRLDIKRFFEQIHENRVFNFFYAKCGCSPRAARLLAYLCCVPLGPKEKPEIERSLARGFATSPRLSLWCNLGLFLRLDWMVKKELRTHNPRIAIYVDDIGITASRIDKVRMDEIFLAAKNILENFDPHQKLPLNPGKKKILSSTDGMEHLGLKLGRGKVSMGNKTLSKLDRIRRKLKGSLSKSERFHLLSKYHSYGKYKNQIVKTKALFKYSSSP
jgi:Reverse transcriptase (RNA-dependent DNA polymerase)